MASGSSEEELLLDRSEELAVGEELTLLELGVEEETLVTLLILLGEDEKSPSEEELISLELLITPKAQDERRANKGRQTIIFTWLL